jgi:hypothetical protein
MLRSAGISTTHSRLASRRGEAQRSHTSFFAEGVAATAVAQHLDGMTQRVGEPQRALLVALQQVVGHALRRLRPDAGQAAQGLDQFFEGGRQSSSDRRARL